MAVQALDERVGEDADVTGCHPHLLRQDDARVQAHDIGTAGDHVAPPLALDVLLELDAERPVVPCRPRAAVDLTGLEDEPPVLCEGDDGIETAGCGHGGSNGRESGDRPEGNDATHPTGGLASRPPGRPGRPAAGATGRRSPLREAGRPPARHPRAERPCGYAVRIANLGEGATMWDFLLRMNVVDGPFIITVYALAAAVFIYLLGRGPWWGWIAHRDRRAHRGRDRRRRRAVVGGQRARPVRRSGERGHLVVGARGVRGVRPRHLEPLVLALVAQAHRPARDPVVRAHRAPRHQRVVRPRPDARVDPRHLDRGHHRPRRPRRHPEPGPHRTAVPDLDAPGRHALGRHHRHAEPGRAEHELGLPRSPCAALPPAGGARRRCAPAAPRDHDDGPARRPRRELHRPGARRVRREEWRTRADRARRRPARRPHGGSAVPRHRDGQGGDLHHAGRGAVGEAVSRRAAGTPVHDGRRVLERRRVRGVLRREVPRGVRQHPRPSPPSSTRARSRTTRSSAPSSTATRRRTTP